MAKGASIAGSAGVPEVIMTNGTLPNRTVPTAPSNSASLNTAPSGLPTNPGIDAASSPSSVDDLSLYLPEMVPRHPGQTNGVQPRYYETPTKEKIVINDKFSLER
eukprot:CAMPEP_0195302286 /NCGR_PEP_ID=MMETSP0707-20130614/30835_1 /TAXON_ID=33640 /ORGANISM="Asterionellopsis glacialis, Strain CCMP134" /LENGTH=104 /DNA_ID=CAMNT_0040365493 /DNA_START=548 /DNA_END=859 /DNA_ORIENTATION=-